MPSLAEEIEQRFHGAGAPALSFSHAGCATKPAAFPNFPTTGYFLRNAAALFVPLHVEKTLRWLAIGMIEGSAESWGKQWRMFSPRGHCTIPVSLHGPTVREEMECAGNRGFVA